jgi:UPF0755 protein
MRRIPRVLLAALFVVTAVGFVYNGFLFLSMSEGNRDEEVEVVVPEGVSARQIGELLEERGVIVSSKRFVILAKVTGKEKKIKAGRYLFCKNMGIRAVLTKLVRGKTRTVTVTIPEGLTLTEIAEILVSELKIDREKFLELVCDHDYAGKRGIQGETFEGFLFPDTYVFNYSVSEQEVVERLVDEFWNVFTDSYRKRAREIGFTVYEVVILASLIEEEAMLEREHPIISQVYHTRLAINKPLECDATIQYALPEHKSILLYKDLKVKSPYNTYTHRGLPPGPIANPGRSALHAALYPANSDYLYYVAKGDGSHIFSKTAEEHYKAIESVRKKKK